MPFEIPRKYIFIWFWYDLLKCRSQSSNANMWKASLVVRVTLSNISGINMFYSMCIFILILSYGLHFFKNMGKVPNFCLHLIFFIYFQLSMLVKYTADLIIISLRINLFSPWYILPWHLLGHAIMPVICFDSQFSHSTRPMTSFCIFIAYINTEGILFNVKITRWD